MKEDLELSAAHRVPQEIIDLIISQACSDKTTLAAFALVSSSCLHIARPYLFADVILYQNSTRPKPGTLSRGKPVSQPHRRLDTGLEIVAASPLIASSIRSVHFYSPASALSSTVTKLFEFISYLSHLHVLALNDVSWPHIQLECLPVVLKSLNAIAPTVEDLFLADCAFANRAEFSAFILAFRNLRRLSLSSVDWKDVLDDSVFPDLHCMHVPRLESLVVERCTSFRDVMEMLMKEDSFDLDLEATSILWDKGLEVPSNFSVYEQFFDIVGRTLRFLILEVDVEEDHDASAITRLLAKCQSLKSISIDISPSWRARPMSFLWARPVLHVLATACSSHLEELTIVCKLSSNLEFNQSLLWMLLDRTLSNTNHFPNLKKLHIRVHALITEQHPASLWPEDKARMKAAVYANLRQLMFKLRFAGILDIEQCNKGNCPKVMSIPSFTM